MPCPFTCARVVFIKEQFCKPMCTTYVHKQCKETLIRLDELREIYTAANSELVTSYFYTSSEINNRVIKNSCFYKQSKALVRLCKLFHLKMTCTFCTDDVRVKVPSFQKVSQFVLYEIFRRDIIRLNFCLFEDIPDCRDLRRRSFKSFASIKSFVSSTY